MRNFIFVFFLSTTAAAWGQAPATENKRKPLKITGIPFLTERLCSNQLPCYEITPDSKGIITLNAQSQLIYFDAKTSKRKKISDSNCNRAKCFAVAPDSSSVSFIKLENENTMAVYKVSLENLLKGKKAAPKKVGELPRFAGIDPKNMQYTLNYCNDGDAVFALSSNYQKSAVHAFSLASANTPRRELFYENGGKVEEVKCDNDGAYFHARIAGAGQTQHQELIIRSSSKLLQNPSAFKEVLLNTETAPGEKLVQDLLATPQGMLVAMQSPSQDPFPSSSLVLNSNQRDEKSISSWSKTNTLGKIIAASNDAFVVSTQSTEVVSNPREGDYNVFKLELSSVASDNGTRISLNENGYSTTEVASHSKAVGNERVLFFEAAGANRNLIVSRLNGAQRMQIAKENLNLRHIAPYTRQALLSPSGKCVLTSTATTGQATKAELTVLSNEERVSDLLPTENIKMRMGDFQVSPDSSFAVFLANPDGERQFHLYKVALPECKE